MIDSVAIATLLLPGCFAVRLLQGEEPRGLTWQMGQLVELAVVAEDAVTTQGRNQKVFMGVQLL